MKYESNMLIADKNAKSIFRIPVMWSVFDLVDVQANSLEEALNAARENASDIPLGTEPEYLDDSYEIIADTVYDCTDYQRGVFCIRYGNVVPLSECKNSMLLDSGTNIISAVFGQKCGKDIFVRLNVCGNVKVNYKGDTYRYPSTFPEGLREMIHINPNTWDTLPDIEVVDQNWFEYQIVCGDIEDSIVCEKDVSQMTISELLADMQKLAEFVCK